MLQDPTRLWKLYSEQEYAQLTEAERKDMFAERIMELQEYFGITDNTSGTISYTNLDKALNWVLDRFDYTPDNYEFNEDDFWDTEAFRKMVLQGFLKDDCDGAGYALLEILFRVFLVYKKNLYRVACRTETGEGHFVAQVNASDGITYQVENRVRKPRSVRYMRDKGYEYMHYSPMTRVDRWYNPDKRMADVIYNTPANLASDKPSFSVSKALRIGKSKSLIAHWTTVGIGAISSTVSTVVSMSGDVVSNLQANQSNLAQFMSPTYLGVLMVILGLIGVYLRTVTNKDIDSKVCYDD